MVTSAAIRGRWSAIKDPHPETAEQSSRRTCGADPVADGAPRALRSDTPRSPALDEPAITGGGASERRRRFGRVEDGFAKRTLIFDRQTDDLGFLDRAVRRFLGGRDDEVADAASLDFCRAFNDGERFGRDARFDARRPVRLPGHHAIPLLHARDVRLSAGQCKEARWWSRSDAWFPLKPSPTQPYRAGPPLFRIAGEGAERSEAGEGSPV